MNKYTKEIEVMLKKTNLEFPNKGPILEIIGVWDCVFDKNRLKKHFKINCSKNLKDSKKPKTEQKKYLFFRYYPSTIPGIPVTIGISFQEM